MEKKYFLMIKQHKQTGLKYLCFHYGTIGSCYTYKGSGKYWTNHLNKHGKDIVTIILKESFDRNEISIEGIKYSNLWDVVTSDDFANLTIECAQTTAEPLQRVEVRKKRDDSLKQRIAIEGLTDKEKIAREKGCAAMQQKDSREKAVQTIIQRHKEEGFTEKEKARYIQKSERCKRGEFTQAELEAYKNISKFQTGKTMQERLNDPNYVDPRKGKTAKEIFGLDYTGPWNYGLKMKEVKGDNYVDPKSKPFKIVSHLGEQIFNCERDFFEQTKFSQPTLTKLKKLGSYKVKRLKNSKHCFNDGETIKYIKIDG